MSHAQELLRAQRENGRLREALLDMLAEAESGHLDGDWWADWPKPPRLCGWLARYLREETAWADDLERYKRARRALGLPWWGGLRYEDGLQPGRGR